MAELAKEEIEGLNGELMRLTSQLKVLLLPKDPLDEKNIMLEVGHILSWCPGLHKPASCSVPCWLTPRGGTHMPCRARKSVFCSLLSTQWLSAADQSGYWRGGSCAICRGPLADVPALC